MSLVYNSLLEVPVLATPVQLSGTSKVTSLGSKVTNITKALDTTKEQLDRPVSSTRGVTRQLVTSQLNSVESQATLDTVATEVAGASERAAVVLRVVRSVEGRARVLLETLQAVPGHVLDGEQSAVGGEEHVEVTGADDGVVGVLDDTLEDTVRGGAGAGVRGGAVVGAIAEDIGVGALLPVGTDRSVDGLLYVGAVEVDNFSWWDVVADVHSSEDGPGVGAHVGDVVDVETWVDFENGGESIIEHITSGVLAGVWVWEERERTGRWEGKVLVHVVEVTTLLSLRSEPLDEALVKVQQVLPVSGVPRDNSLLLVGPVTDDGIIDGNALKVVIVGVVGGDVCIGDVWHIVSCIGLASEIDIPAMGIESVDERLVEPNELKTKLNLVGDVGNTLGEANTDGLLDPQHVGQVVP